MRRMEENPHRKPLATQSGCIATVLILLAVGLTMLYLAWH
jgi:hypothetical protein